MTDLGRRDRKKRQTRAAIEQAAVSLVAEAGLSQVTVEAIAERADVTTRTFFNYFADKEDAVLGILRGEGALTGDDAGQGVPEGPIIDVGLALLRGQLQAMGQAHPAANAERRLILTRHPELVVRQVERYVAVEDQLTAVLIRVLERDQVPEPDRGRLARAATFVLTAAARLAVEQWCREPGAEDDPSAYLDEGVDLLALVLAGHVRRS
jgi:AcrR family transcriptional regulator